MSQSQLGIATKYGLIQKGQEYVGYIEGEYQYKQFIEDLKAIGVVFATTSTNFGKLAKVMFHNERTDKCAGSSITYCGMPFQMVKTTYMACAQGGPIRTHPPKCSPDGKLSPKKKRAVRQRKKIDCPAVMTVRCLKVFTDDCYKALSPSYKAGSWEIRKISQQLHKDLQTSDPPVGMLRFVVVMSSAEVHTHTPVTTKITGIIHPRLREAISSFVDNNICSTKAMKTHLEEFVKRMFEDSGRPIPDRMNRCYYPRDNVIRFHMHKALFQVRQSEYDQEALGEFTATWVDQFPDDKFAFRPYLVEDVDRVDEENARSTFLFCHQTKWQQDLLARYGNTLSLLDTTYKATRSDIPFFFIIVKTNSDYCIVGTFVVQSCSDMLITEALSQFKAWNPCWEPKFFLTDYSEPEIKAIEDSFPQSTLYICGFHRKQAWHRWLCTRGNVSKEAIDPLKEMWEDIAASCTEEEYVHNLNFMYGNKFYQKNSKAQEYFAFEWLPADHRWVYVKLAKDFTSYLNINNGVESLNKFLKHSYLKNYQESRPTLSGLIKSIIESILPEALQTYSISNAVAHGKNQEYIDNLPFFLRNRPICFIEHMKDRFETAKLYDSSNITVIGEGRFCVRNELQSNEWCCVDVEEASCECDDFNVWRFPCKHMCAVFMYTDWVFDRLPVSYRENPYVTVDSKYAVVIETTGDDVDNSTLDNDLGLVDSETIIYDIVQSSTDRCGTSPLASSSTRSKHEPHVSHALSPEEAGRLELRKNLNEITRYSCFQFTPNNLSKAVEMTRQLTEVMKSLVTKSKDGVMLGPAGECIPVQGETITKKEMYADVPKRIKIISKIKSVGKPTVTGVALLQHTTTQIDFLQEKAKSTDSDHSHVKPVVK